MLFISKMQIVLAKLREYYLRECVAFAWAFKSPENKSTILLTCQCVSESNLYF